MLKKASRSVTFGTAYLFYVRMEKTPKKWKLTILVWLATYPIVTLLAVCFGHYFEKIEALPLRTLASTIIAVPVAVYVLVPVLEKVLNNWLNK
jgi:antibiotic biosynthesis monooxygenase (ABM) superfamily enzyme